MRLPHIRKDRQCIRPEINRVFHFGWVGESAGQFYWQHLSKIKSSTAYYDWVDTKDWRLKEYLNRIETEESYSRWLAPQVIDSKEVRNPSTEIPSRGLGPQDSFRIRSTEFSHYQTIAKYFNLMPDWKEGIMRGSFKHVLPFTWTGGSKVFIHREWPFNES